MRSDTAKANDLVYVDDLAHTQYGRSVKFSMAHHVLNSRRFVNESSLFIVTKCHYFIRSLSHI